MPPAGIQTGCKGIMPEKTSAKGLLFHIAQALHSSEPRTVNRETLL